MSETTPQNPFAYRSDGYAWFVVFMLCLASVISFIDRQIINLLVDPIKADLGISDTQISLLQGFAFALFYSLVAIPLGRAADSKNRKVIILAGMVLWSIATALCGIAKVFWQLFVARMLVGVGEATLSPAGFSMLSDYFPRKSLTRALSVFTGSSFFGSGVAFIIGGYIFAQMVDFGPVTLPVVGEIRPWQMTFLIVSIPGLVLAAIIWAVVKEPPRIGAGKEQVDNPMTLGDAWGYVKNHKQVLGPVVIGFTFLAMMMFSLGAWTPSFFIRVHDMTPSEIGPIFGSYFLIFGTAGVISGGLISDWFKARGYDDSNMRAGMLSALAATPFLIAFPLVADKDLALILLAPVIYFGTMPFGTGPSALPLIVPNRLRGQVMALYLLIGNLIGQGCGPWLVAFFTDFVMGDDKGVGISISVVCSTIVVIGAIVLFFGMPAYRDHMKRMDEAAEGSA